MITKQRQPIVVFCGVGNAKSYSTTTPYIQRDTKYSISRPARLSRSPLPVEWVAQGTVLCRGHRLAIQSTESAGIRTLVSLELGMNTRNYPFFWGQNGGEKRVCWHAGGENFRRLVLP